MSVNGFIYVPFLINYIHHIDRWRFVFHGGIDGFSRLIFFLKVANNNRSKTVFDGFLDGVRKYGVPSRVRYYFPTYPLFS